MLSGMNIIIDYFRATFDFKCPEGKREKEVANEIKNNICHFLNVTEDEVTPRYYGKDRYQMAFNVGDDMDLMLIGPKSKYGWNTCSFMLKGQGCREFERRNPDKTWYDFLSFFVTILGAIPSRIDVTIDDFDGDVVNFKWLKNKLDHNFYTSSFQKKYYKIHGCEKEGYTIEMGSRTSTQMLSIYEKLKEQQMKNKKVNANYWLRYEMRYMHQKALDVSLDLIDTVDKAKEEGKDLRDAWNTYVLSIFYDMLDIKEDNNYDKGDQDKVNTDLKWKIFLRNVDKVNITKPEVKQNKFDSYKTYTLQTFPLYLLVNYYLCNNDLNSTFIKILSDTIPKLDEIDLVKLKKINVFLKDMDKKSIKLEDIKKLKELLENYVSNMRLPF